MTGAEERSLERAVGRIEARLDAQSTSIAELKADMKSEFEGVKDQLNAADDWRHQVKQRLEAMEAHGAHMTEVADAFDALQKSIHEGTLKAKSFMSGAAWGVALAGGAVGATFATFFKSIAAWLGNFFSGA